MRTTGGRTTLFTASGICPLARSVVGAGHLGRGTRGGRRCRSVITEVGHVPTRPFKLEARSGDLFVERFLPAFGAGGQRRIGYFSQGVLGKTAGAAFVGVNRHGRPHKNRGKSMILAGFRAIRPRTRQQHGQVPKRNIAAATNVGANAHPNRRNGAICPPGKLPFRMANAAGLGAFAMTVRPPPVTAPATSM